MLRFINEKSGIVIDLESWDFVKENGGLKWVFDDMGFNYEEMLNEGAIKEKIEFIKIMKAFNPETYNDALVSYYTELLTHF